MAKKRPYEIESLYKSIFPIESRRDAIAQAGMQRSGIPVYTIFPIEPQRGDTITSDHFGASREQKTCLHGFAEAKPKMSCIARQSKRNLFCKPNEQNKLACYAMAKKRPYEIEPLYIQFFPIEPRRGDTITSDHFGASREQKHAWMNSSKTPPKMNCIAKQWCDTSPTRHRK